MASNLTPEEKAAGKRFRDKMQSLLLESFEIDPPVYQVLPFWSSVRHLCEKRNNISTGLELKEIYLQNTTYVVIKEGKDTLVAISEDDESFESLSEDEKNTIVPAGRFAFIYKMGKCSKCGQTARSKSGRLVDAMERAPLRGKVAR